jgi:hypothetical protein
MQLFKLQEFKNSSPPAGSGVPLIEAQIGDIKWCAPTDGARKNPF